ncbi:MAG TPA: Gfo/Idh/MocA family oxidoreductase [Thermoanaerobaculia bacterium]
MANVGIVGTGWGARVQVPAFREAGLTIAGVAGAHKNKTTRLAGELGIRAFDDWRSLINEPAIDLVTIVTPPAEHLEMARSALAAGKHVVSEKPTALNAREAEQLVDVARRHPDRLALIDHELRFTDAWRTARERIGEIGAMRYAEVRYASPGRGDRTREWNWWSDADRGGGIWGAVGSHFVDTFRYLGFEIEAAQAVMHAAFAERPFGESTRRVTSDDIAAVHLRFRGGAPAMLAISAVASGPDEPATITLHGESGAMRLVGEQLLLATPMKPFVRIAGGELQQRPGNSPGGAFGTGTVLLGHALRAALDDGDRSALAIAATFEDGLAQQRVLDAARQSAENDGRWMPVLGPRSSVRG